MAVAVPTLSQMQQVGSTIAANVGGTFTVSVVFAEYAINGYGLPLPGAHSAIVITDNVSKVSYIFSAVADLSMGFPPGLKAEMITSPDGVVIPGMAVAQTINLGTFSADQAVTAMDSIANTTMSINNAGLSYLLAIDNCTTVSADYLSGLASRLPGLPLILPTPVWSLTPGVFGSTNYPWYVNVGLLAFDASLSADKILNGGIISSGLIAAASYLSRDPLVVALDGQNLNISALSARSPEIATSGSSFSEKSSWIGQGIGFLVDSDAAGSVTLFTGTASGGNGFAQLALLDVNGTGHVDASDPGFASLGIWQDTNGNGIADPGEVESLSSLGIVSLNLTYAASTQAINGSEVVGIGLVTMADGTTRELADVDLQTSPTYTQANVLPAIPDAVAAMAQLHGYGTVMDLHSQMAIDPALQGLVASFSQMAASGADNSDLRAATDAILFRWAGVDGVDPGSRGGIMDARRLEFIEHYLGQAQVFPDGNYGDPSDPGTVPALLENQAFIDLESGALARLLVQDSLSIASEFTYDPVADAVSPTVDVVTSVSNLAASLGPISSSNLSAWKNVAAVLDAYRSDYSIDEAVLGAVLSFSGVTGLDILVNAISQGLIASVDTAGVLHVSNAAYDGMLSTEYARFAGLAYNYLPGDGAVSIDFAESANLEINQGPGGVPNTLFLGGAPTDFTVAVQANGDEVFTDGITGDSLTITGELMSDGDVQRGIQAITFVDGTVWTRAHAVAYADQTILTSPFIDVTYDTSGYTATIAASGGGNTVIFGAGYGHITASETGHGGTIQLLAGINPADVTYFFRGDDTDSVQIVNELYGNGIGDSGYVSKMLFADGTSDQIGVAPDQSSSTPFTFEYYATATSTTLAGNALGTNIYHLAAGSDLIITTVGYGLIDYGLGDGAAVVNTTAPGYGASADISLAVGITPDMVYLQVDNYSDLVVRFRGDPTDSIYLRNDIFNTAAGTVSSVSHLLFADGTSLLLGVLPDGSASNPLTYEWYGSASTTVLTGDRSGSNIYHLAPGDDTVVTTTGYSATIYSLGDGNATIRPTWTGGSSGDIAFGPGITAADLYFQVRNYHDLVIRFHGDDADSITIQNGVYGTAPGTITAVSNLLFSDGSAMALGMSADGTYNPMAYDWYGDASTTTLTGDPTGSNVFHLAPGGDLVITTTGYSQVLYSQGDGNTTIRPTAAGDGGSADLVFGPGITAADIYFQNANYDDLVIRFHGDDTDSITITGDLYDTSAGTVSKMPDLVFSDGTSELIGLSPDQTAYNPVKFDWYADASTTVLSGGDHGSSEFHLAAGGDTVYTAATYSQIDFDKGDGNATVRPTGPWFGGAADISLGAGLDMADLILTPEANNDLVISFRGDTSDSLTLQNDIYGGGTGGMVSYLKFADGAQLRIGIPATDTFVGDATHTVLQGSDDHNNIFELGAGSDSVTAGVGGTDLYSAIAQYIDPLAYGVPNQLFVLPPQVENVFDFGRGDGHADVDMKLGFGVLNLQGLNLTDVTVTGTGRDLMVAINGDSADSIHIHSSQPVTGFGLPGPQIAGNLDSITFADGQTATVASLLQHAA